MSADLRRSAAPLQIAIDGPVASGKSTVAKELARRLHCVFLDTGALYRAVAYTALARGVDVQNEEAVSALLGSHPVRVMVDDKARGYRITMAEKTLGGELFSAGVSRAVSPIAAMPNVRAQLIGVQREFADARDVVMAGRDIGSVVLPEAKFKIFLTATLEARVERRLAELHSAGVPMERAALYAEIRERDERDTSRSVSPLVRAAGAIELDTSQLSVAQVVEALLQRIGR
jgi:cytidylate kinase